MFWASRFSVLASVHQVHVAAFVIGVQTTRFGARRNGHSGRLQISHARLELETQTIDRRI